MVSTKQKRKNATELEGRSNECVIYTCDIYNGLSKRSNDKCYSTNEVHRVCVNDECKVDESWKEGWVVEIEPEKKVNVTDLDKDELLDNVTKQCKGLCKNITLGVESDEDGYVVRVYFSVSDKESADSIREAAEMCKPRHITSSSSSETSDAFSDYQT